MAKSSDELVAEKIDPAEPTVSADSDINDPPKPLKVVDENLASVHSVLAQIVAAIEGLAAQSGTLASRGHLEGIKASLAALFDRAHK